MAKMEYNLLDQKINHVQNEVDKAKTSIQELKPTEKQKVCLVSLQNRLSEI